MSRGAHQCLPNGGTGGNKRPIRGSIKLSVLLCQYADHPTPSSGVSYYEGKLLRESEGGNLADYFHSISNGNVDLCGSEIGGWYKMNMKESDHDGVSRQIRINDCIDAAQDSGLEVDSSAIPVIIFSSDSSFGAGAGPGLGAIYGRRASVTMFAHEIGHGLFLYDSFTDDTSYCNIDWAHRGMYGDPWDIMSAMAVYRTDKRWGEGGPGMNIYHLDRLGWLKRSKIKRFGADGEIDQTLTLTAVSHPNGSGYQMIRIPFDPLDLNRYYTIEYRLAEDWDGGIGQDRVLIHEVDDRDVTRCSSGETKQWHRVSYILSNTTGVDTPFESINRNGVRIDLVGKNSNDGSAQVRVRTTTSVRCIPGFVWREAKHGDYVCVSPSRRTKIVEENQLASSRRSPNGGSDGPDTCKEGFVWRRAYPEDHVCVLPSSQSVAARENSHADLRRIGGQAHGPNACKDGYVWREADDNDWVCVTPSRRAEVDKENQLDQSLHSPSGGSYGSETCKQGFVWREACPGDHTCVSVSSRNKAHQENLKANSLLLDKEA